MNIDKHSSATPHKDTTESDILNLLLLTRNIIAWRLWSVQYKKGRPKKASIETF